jgi:hypothetical protein
MTKAGQPTHLLEEQYDVTRVACALPFADVRV